MQWPTSNFEFRSSPAAPPGRPLVGVIPDSSSRAVAAHAQTSERTTAPLAELASRSSLVFIEALDHLVTLEVELRSVVNIVAERPWSEEDRRRYRALSRQQRKAYRRWTAARHWFDDIRARLYENSS